MIHYSIILFTLFFYVSIFLNFILFDFYSLFHYFVLIGFPVLIIIPVILLKGQGFLDEKKTTIHLLLLGSYLAIVLVMIFVGLIRINTFYTVYFILDIVSVLELAVKFTFFVVALALMVDDQNPIQQPADAARVGGC